MKSVHISILASAVGVALFGAGIAPVAFGSGHADIAATAGDSASVVPGRYIVTFAEAGLVAYKGDVAGLARTAPVLDGVSQNSSRKFNVQSSASQAYKSYLQQQRAAHIQAIENALGRPLTVKYTYEVTRSAISAEMSSDEAAKIAQLPGIASVSPVREMHTDTFRGPTFIGANTIWDGTAVPSYAAATRGQGVKVGVIDTGTNIGHPSFTDDPMCGFGPSNPKLHPADCNTNDGTHCTGTSPNAPDGVGHGVHTSSTAAGNTIDNTVTPAPLLPDGVTMSGVAPCATLYTYRVATATGGISNDAIDAAIQNAIVDQVDVVNFSIGPTCGGGNPWSDSTDFLQAEGADVFVAASAGNTRSNCTNPVGLVANNGPWMLTVAASTQDEVLAQALEVTTPAPVPANIQKIEIVAGSTTAVPFTEPLTNYPLRVYTNNLSGCSDTGGIPVGYFDNSIAVVRRGFQAPGTVACSFVEKVTNATNAGAVMVVIANNQDQILTMDTTGTTTPSFIINTLAESDALIAFVAAHQDESPPVDPDVIFKDGFDGQTPIVSGVLGNYDRGAIFNVAGDILGGFSFRGPTQAPYDNLTKPDITGPGINIYAAFDTAEGSYGLDSGTSMSSPHLAGSAALVRAVHPDWTPMEVKSALQTTAKIAGFQENGTTQWTVDQVGSGRVDLSKASLAGLTLDESVANFQAANPSGGTIDQSQLNLASLRNVRCNGTCTWTRTFKNRLHSNGSWTVGTTAPAGFTLTASPASFSLAQDATQTVTFTATGSSTSIAFGQVTLHETSSRSPDQHLTVAVKGTPVTAPVISVTPSSLASTQAANTTQTQTLTVKNTGGGTLTWNVSATGTGSIWSQPKNSTGGIVSDFSTSDNGGGYTAADFTVSGASTGITKITTYGFDNTNSLLSQPKISWRIYSDAGGAPSGNPDLGTGTPLWSFDTAPTGAGVSVANTGDITLDLTAAGQSLNLPAGTYWLTVFPTYTGAIGPAGSARWNWSQALLQAGPGMLTGTMFGVSNWTALQGLVGWPDVAFDLQGTVNCGASWLSLAPTSGSAAAGASNPVTVTFNSTGLTAGTYIANACIASNDTTNPVVVTPVTMTVTAVPHTVTPSSSGNGSINPNTPQTVNDGATAQFTLTPDSGYHIDNVTGTCGGNLSGSTFTTNAVTADCTVVANFAINAATTHTVTPSVGTGAASGTISPDTVQTVNDGSTAAFTLTPAAGYHFDSVGGTCPAGTSSGTSYTTGAITADCTIVANFAADAGVAGPGYLYSNLGTDAGAALINGTATTSGTTRYTPMSCSKLTLAQPGPQLITQYSWAIANANASATTTSITTSVVFYDDTGTSGGPGTRLKNSNGAFIGGGNFGIAYPASSTYLGSAAPLGFLSTQVPAGVQNVWACVYFSGASAQTTLMANLGLEKYANAPTAGSTTDLAFVTTSTAASSPAVDAPAGNFVTGSGAANVFGWELVTVGQTALLDTYYNKNAAGSSVAGTGLALNSATGVGRNFAGYAATVAAPPTGSKWQITGVSLYPLCNAAATFTDTRATIQFWDTFNGTTAADVFGNSTPIATTTVDMGPQTCASGTSLFFSHVKLPAPITVVGTSGTLGITVQYFADSGSGLVAQGDLVSTLGTATTTTPLPAVGSNASTNGWYKSASNRSDLNFTGSTDYVSTARQSIVIQAYGQTVSGGGPVTHTVTPSSAGNGSISPNTPVTVNDGSTTTFTLAPNAGYHADSVGGTCPAGTLTGNSYVTGAITADCTVVATFAQDLVPPTIAASFAPNTHVGTGVASTLTLTLANSNATTATLSSALVDNLPTGVVVAATPNAATTCASGTVTANAGDASFNLGSGAAIPASGTCTVTVAVSSSTAGAYTNTVAAGALQTNVGNNANAASDNLVVAGTFPTPFTSETFASGVEPISRVIFAGIDNASSTSTSTSSANYMQDFTTTVTAGQVAPRGGYTITVYGNTDGNYDDYVSVYFDWNHDGTFNEDSSELTLIGSLTNSNGNVTTSTPTSSTVIVPPTAKPGLTRMRVVKSYGAYGSSSGEQGFGQTEDYLVLVDPSLTPPPTPALVAQAFTPDYVASGAGGISTFKVTLTNYNATDLALTSDFTNTFPAGLVVAPTPNATTTCVGGSVTAVAGSGSVTLGTGAVVPNGDPIGSCTLSVDVTTASADIYVNSIAAGAVMTANGGSPATASATVQFYSSTPTYSTGFESPFTAANVYNQQGWYSANVTSSGQTANSSDWKVATSHPAAGSQQLRATWTSAGQSTAYSFALSPESNAGTSAYSTISANLAIQTSSTGATFDFAPQDSTTGSVITRVRFLKSGTSGGTSGKIQVLDPYATSSDGYTDTGATWTGATSGAAYFALQVVADRNAGTFAVCVNGTRIWAGDAFSSNITDLAILGNKGTGTQNNILDVDDLVIDNPMTDGGCTPAPSAQSPSPMHVQGATRVEHAALRRVASRD